MREEEDRRPEYRKAENLFMNIEDNMI